MPLSSATYVSSVDKIFGVYGPQVMKFNANTGALEARSNIVTGPCEATCGIVYHAATAMLYVSTWNSMANQFEGLPHPNVDIFPVDPGTLAVGAGLGWTTIYNDGGDMRWPSGPRMLFDFGEPDLYFIGTTGNAANETWLGKIDPASPAADSMSINGLNLWSEQASSDGTWTYFCKPGNPEVERADMALASDDTVPFTELGTITPISIEHAPITNKQYVICGNQFMARIDTWSPNAYTILNLDLVNAGSEPMRLRYRSSDDRLYIPCQTTDGIILWEPSNDGSPNTTWWRGGAFQE